MQRKLLITATATLLTMNALAPALAAPVAPGPDAVDGIMPVPVHNTCHQNIRTHGGSFPPHSHRQFDCAVVIAGGGGGGYDQDCHANVRRHFVPGYGSVWHRHSGGSCQPLLYEQQGGPVPGVGGCIRVGPLTVCP